MSKKIISVLLIGIMMMSVLCACSGTNEAPEEVPEFTIENDLVNYYGKEFILTDIVHHGDTPLIPTYGENALDDRLLQHYKDVETKLNCVLTLQEGSMDKLTVNINSGEKYTDIMNLYFGNILSLFKGGYIVDFNEIDGMNLHSGKYGNENLLSALSFGSGTYGIYAEYWGVPSPYFADAMLYNPRLINQYGQANPYELFENKEWSWDNFEKIALAVTDTTSNPDKPIYATANNNYFTRSAFFSNGATIAKKNSDGRLEFNLPSAEASEAADWVNKLIGLKIFDTGSSTSSWEGCCDMFSNGQYVFLSEYSWVGLSKDNGRVGLKMEEEFSWICFPRGPHGNYETLATYADANFAMCVPINASTDEIGYFLEELLEPIFEDEYSWREHFAREVFWDDNSYKIYIQMLESAVPVYDYLTSGVMDRFSLACKGLSSSTEAFESIAQRNQDLLDTNYNNFLN